MTSRSPPIESFGPELLAALIRGSREEVVVRFATWKKAKAFQIRAMHLRRVMKDEKHPLYPIVARARISLDWVNPNGLRVPGHKCPPTNPPTTATIRPHDDQYSTELREAGITIEDTTSLIPEATAARSIGDESLLGFDPLDEYLKDKESSK